jgi:hypothetical protein
MSDKTTKSHITLRLFSCVLFLYTQKQLDGKRQLSKNRQAYETKRLKVMVKKKRDFFLELS